MHVPLLANRAYPSWTHLLDASGGSNGLDCPLQELTQNCPNYCCRDGHVRGKCAVALYQIFEFIHIAAEVYNITPKVKKQT
jgi:hypothetical protein